jgi:hypothetical protein
VEEYFSLVFHNDSGEKFFFPFSLINVEISRIFNERGSSIYWLYIYIIDYTIVQNSQKTNLCRKIHLTLKIGLR